MFLHIPKNQVGTWGEKKELEILKKVTAISGLLLNIDSVRIKITSGKFYSMAASHDERNGGREGILVILGCKRPGLEHLSTITEHEY